MPDYQERGILDPISEDPANVPLEITGSMVPDGVNGHAIGLREWNFPRPEMASTFIPTIASEGDKRSGAPRFANRVIPVEVYIAESQGVNAAGDYMVNPSFEKDLTGWSAVSSATLTRVLAGYAGEYALQVATTSTNGSGVTSAVLTTSIPSTPWVASAFVKAKDPADVGKIVKLQLAEYTNTPTLVGTTVATATLTAEWQRVSVTRTFGATGNKAAVLVTNNSAQSVGVLVDALQLEVGAQTYYYDGDTPGCKWTGTPHASTSTRRGLGRKRFLQAVYDLEAKIEKLARSGGTLKRYLHDGTPIVFDIIEANFTGDWSPTMAQGQSVFKFELTCKPAARLPQITYPLRTKAAAKSVLSAIEGPVPGNYPALGRLEITDTATQDRRFLLTALQSDRLDTSATGEVEFLAKNLTPLSGAAVVNSPGTAGNTNGGFTSGVVSGSLTNSWAPLLSGKTSGGVYPTHKGTFRVWARVWVPTSATGDISIRLDYSGADLTRWVSNPPRYIPAGAQRGAWSLIDLGVVRLEPPQNAPWGSSGAWRWEPRISAMSTNVGDALFIDTLEIIPAGEFYAESRTNAQPYAAPGGSLASGFGTASASALNGRVAQTGGTWSGSGPTDFVTNSTTTRVLRTPAASDGTLWGGRFARLGTGTAGGVRAESEAILLRNGTSTVRSYLILRYVNTSNFAFGGVVYLPGGGVFFHVGKRVAGATTTLGLNAVSLGNTADLDIRVLADGSIQASIPGESSISVAPDADLATGGTLASGGYGIYGEVVGSNLVGTQSGFIGFNVTSLATVDSPPDLVLASGRKAFIASDRSLRQSADGSAVGEIGKYEGDRLLVPCAGPEGKSLRWSVMDSRVDPDNAADSNLDTLTGQLSVIPRVTDVPEPQ